jgi:hypothetical protein
MVAVHLRTRVLTRAARAGLVMYETRSRFLAANPSNGGDPKLLNLPSMRNVQCAPHCTWTCTVRNTLTPPSTWPASTSTSVPGFNISVSPASFSFNGGVAETQQITVTAKLTTALTGPVAFGEVRLTEASKKGAAGIHPDVRHAELFCEPMPVGSTTRLDVPVPNPRSRTGR